MPQPKDIPPQEIRVLLAEDDAGDALIVSEMLGESENPAFAITRADRLAVLRERLLAKSFDVILLDLSLPDGQGLPLVTAVREAAPQTPIVVMSGQRDDAVAVQIVQAGVQDYWVKGHVDGFQLGRSLRYAIERKRIEDELRRTNAELAVLLRVSSIASRTTDMGGVLADIIDSIAELENLDLERRGIILTMEDGGALRLAHAAGYSQDLLEAYRYLGPGNCPCGQAASEGLMIVSAPGDHHPHCATGDGNQRGHIIVPLKARERVLGVLCLNKVPYKVVHDADRQVLLAIGEQIGIAMENASLYEETRRLSLHDPLTGLANRRHLDIVAEGTLAMARRYGTPFSIILLDLDHFKLYNDTHGHCAGDQLLIAVACTMKNEVRDTNLVVRYGGEEFLILLPDTPTRAALSVAERIREKIHEHTGETVSMGVAGAKDGAKSMNELIAVADAALYQAKDSGRNRVVCAAPPYEDTEVRHDQTS